MKNKRGFLELSFAWIFALVVGGFILFLSIYIAIKISGPGEALQDVIVSKELGVLLNPLESGFEESQTIKIELQKNTRIGNRCENEGSFGRQVIGVNEETFGKWSANGSEAGFLNKYIFSENYTEGKNFYIFSSQFMFPFKVADLMVLMSTEKIYCFIDAPQEVQDKMFYLKLKNVVNKSASSQCPPESVTVCYSGNCDIRIMRNVGSESGQVAKKGKEPVTYDGEALMYAAIFSDPEIYECQLKRLMQRTKQLASLYNQKAAFVTRYGCNSNLQLASLISSIGGYTKSQNILSMVTLVNNIKTSNDNNRVCRLW